jgi:3-hydroxybutyryl-CoA dehydrogenase
MNVVVLGAGLMGSQIGWEYALAGHRVTFVARRPEAARHRLDQAIELSVRCGLAGVDRIAVAGKFVQIVAAADEIAESADLVVESVVESLAVKTEVLADAARRWPGAVLASNTSSLSIGALGEAAGAPERTIGTHYWNPPLLMPLVEVIAGDRTAPVVVSSIVAILRGLGKRSVRVGKDVPGFVWNRLQLALLREATWIVEQGVATPEVVDEIVRDGLARRWRLTGPFETVALGGPGTFTRIAANLFPVLSDATELHDIGRWLTGSEAAYRGLRERRDAGLIAELERERGANTAPDDQEGDAVEAGGAQ